MRGLSAHVPHDDEVIILEGRAEFVNDPGSPLATASTQGHAGQVPAVLPGR